MIKLEHEVEPLFRLGAKGVSYSRLNTFKSCGYKYYLQYILKKQQSFGMAAQLGNIIHKALEVTMSDDYNFDAKDLYSNYFIALAEMDPDSRIPKSMTDDGLRMLEEYANTTQVARAEDFADTEPILNDNFFAEMSFNLYLGRGCFQGYIDRIVVQEKSVYVTDYKCVVADTQFWRNDGTIVLTSDLKIGDEIIGWDEDYGLHYTEVLDIIDNGVQPIMLISTLNGRQIKVTPNHPVMTQRGWVEAKYLDINDRIMVGMNLGKLYREFPIEIEEILSLPDQFVLADIITDGPFDAYLRYQDDLLSYNSDYWTGLIRLIFNGKYRRGVFNMTIAQDVQTILAQMGFNSAIGLSAGSWFVEIDADSKMPLFHLLMNGQESNDFLASDKIIRVSNMKPQQTWGISVDGNNTHVTNGLVTHNSGKWEVAQKNIPSDRQLQIYSLVARKMWPDKAIHAELHYLKSGKIKGHWFTNEELDIAAEEISKDVDRLIDTRNFLHTPNKWDCKMCSFATDGSCSVGQYRLKSMGLLGDYIE